MLIFSLWKTFLNFPHLSHKTTTIFQPPAGISERKVVPILSSPSTTCSTENSRDVPQHLRILQDADANMHLARSTLVVVCKSTELFTCLVRQVLEPFIGQRCRKLPGYSVQTLPYHWVIYNCLYTTFKTFTSVDVIWYPCSQSRKWSFCSDLYPL